MQDVAPGDSSVPAPLIHLTELISRTDSFPEGVVRVMVTVHLYVADEFGEDDAVAGTSEHCRDEAQLPHI